MPVRNFESQSVFHTVVTKKVRDGVIVNANKNNSQVENRLMCGGIF